MIYYTISEIPNNNARTIVKDAHQMIEKNVFALRSYYNELCDNDDRYVWPFFNPYFAVRVQDQENPWTSQCHSAVWLFDLQKEKQVSSNILDFVSGNSHNTLGFFCSFDFSKSESCKVVAMSYHMVVCGHLTNLKTYINRQSWTTTCLPLTSISFVQAVSAIDEVLRQNKILQQSTKHLQKAGLLN